MSNVQVYYIPNWDDVFENNRSREIKRPTWVPVSNSMDDDTFVELMQHRNGAAHFGVWICLILVGSRCDPRGTLIKNNGIPHNSCTLRALIRTDSRTIQTAIDRLVAIGLLKIKELNGDIPQYGARTPQEPDASRARVLERKKEGKDSTALPCDQFFETRYVLHPRKGHRTSAEQRLCQIEGIETADLQAAFIRVHDAWIASDEWKWRGGAKAPFFDEWIADRGYQYPPNAEPVVSSAESWMPGEYKPEWMEADE